MAGFETFDRDLRLATAGISAKAVSAELARFARAELARAIASGEGSVLYDRYVNGRAGAPEESVEAPGPIVYVFNWWKVVIVEALAALARLSPQRTGRYAQSFIVIVDGQVVSAFDDIPAEAEVILTNHRPYTRKVHVGAMQMNVPARIFDRARRSLYRRVPRDMVDAQVRFLDIGGGVHPAIPYLLKRGQKRRRDRQAGMPISYPSLVLNLVR